MSLKSKGINAERDLVHKFWAQNWACIRIAGSGSIKYPSPDVLVSNRVKRLAIECKTIQDTKKYFPLAEIKALETFADMFGAQPWVAIKFKKTDWYFLPTNELEKTEKSFLATLELMQRKGYLFEELVA